MGLFLDRALFFWKKSLGLAKVDQTVLIDSFGIYYKIQQIAIILSFWLSNIIISLLRLVIFVFPIAYLFTKSENVTNIVWWTFLIAEILTSLFHYLF